MPNGKIGMSQVDLAILTETSQSAINRYETKNLTPNGTTLVKLADAVQTSIDYLMSRVDDPRGVATLTSGEQAVLDALRNEDFPRLFDLLARRTNESN